MSVQLTMLCCCSLQAMTCWKLQFNLKDQHFYSLHKGFSQTCYDFKASVLVHFHHKPGNLVGSQVNFLLVVIDSNLITLQSHPYLDGATNARRTCLQEKHRHNNIYWHCSVTIISVQCFLQKITVCCRNSSRQLFLE